MTTPVPEPMRGKSGERLAALACLFAKVPQAGQVKTRLARHVGPQAAADLAACMLQDSWAKLNGDWFSEAVASGLVLGAVLSLAGEGHLPELQPTPTQEQLWPQGGGDLGERQERALRRGLQRAPVVLALGMDSPTLPLWRLPLLDLLEGRLDAAMMPTEDGGYCLLALRRCPAGLFAGLPWSSPHTATALLNRLTRLGLSWRRLAPWFDVDELPDLRRLAAELVSNPEQAPATARWCSAHHSTLDPLGASP